jgi:hypothetical protein
MDPIQLDHIAIALPRIADAPPDLVGLLGGIPEHNQPGRGFRWASWTYAGGERIEILEPVGADGFLRRFLASEGPGVHHVTFKVPDSLPRPSGVPGAPPPGRIVGLRMRAQSAERALTQWRDMLEGRVETTLEGGLVFRWPPSPMRIAVDLEETGSQGPVAIELVGDAPAAALEAAGARLGIRLDPV